ncbi:MAG TPA: hypothetical protein VGL61_11580 [Kofleriaceae bacterium]
MIVDLLVIGYVVDVAALGNGNDAVAGRCRNAVQTGHIGGISTVRFGAHDIVPESRARPRSTGRITSMSPFTRLSTNV